MRAAHLQATASRPRPTRSLPAACVGAALMLIAAAGAAVAHEAPPAARATAAPTARSQAPAALGLESVPAPLAARFGVSITAAPGRDGAAARPTRAEWTFVRSADRIALHKGGIDEIWTRDAGGRIGFERIFHDDRTIVAYSPGELATLGVHADWPTLARFIDPLELRALRFVARSGKGDAERIRLAGTADPGAQSALLVEWLPAWQLPARIVRRGKDGSLVRIELEQRAAAPLPGWLVGAAGTQDYARIDAADFGDMEYDPVVRKAEALDVRGGWRQPHAPH